MTHEVFSESDSLVVFKSGNYFHIDTDQKLDKKVPGVFTDKYNVDEKDLAGKKFKFLKDRGALTGERYLYAVHITRTDNIKDLCEKFDVKPPKFDAADDRDRLFKDDNTEILEYSEASYAVFTKDKQVIEVLAKRGCKYNPGLMGPGNIRAPGYIIGKKAASKDDFMDDLVKLAENNCQDFEGNDIIQEGGRRGNKVYSVWGELNFVADRVIELRGDDNELFTLESKSLPKGRIYIKVEVNEND